MARAYEVFSVSLSTEKAEAVRRHLEAENINNRSAYIKRLIEADMAKAEARRQKRQTKASM